MKLVRAAESKRYENAPTCTAFEYETGNRDINVARIEVTGRYPLVGSAINTAVTELVYVAAGSGEVVVGGVSYALATRDVMSIEKGERVSWEGTMTLVIACAPAWTPEQYLQVE